MRQIGMLPPGVDTRGFVDHLLTLGISTRLDERPDGGLLWVHNEDQLGRARQELDAFLKNPDDPRYHVDAKQSAEAIRREAQRLEKQYRRNVRDLRGRWDQPNLRRRPLTSLLAALSIAVFVVGRSGRFGWNLYNMLTFTFFVHDGRGGLLPTGLAPILHGEVWRLVTPIFLHHDYLHIVFNMWWLWVLGSLIEYRRGTRTLFAIVLISAVASNVGEYVYELNFGPGVARFGGMSGVVYAFLGYVWMKGRHQPEQGMILTSSSVQWMLIWLVLCFTGAVGNIANAAHVVGLAAGVLLGLARF